MTEHCECPQGETLAYSGMPGRSVKPLSLSGMPARVRLLDLKLINTQGDLQ